MNIIGLSAQQFDPDGAGILRLTPESSTEIQTGQRRMTKTATLDGKASLYDTGYTLADESWRLVTPASDRAVALVKHFCQNYQKINASTTHGMLEGSPQRWRLDGPNVILEFSVLGAL